MDGAQKQQLQAAVQAHFARLKAANPERPVDKLFLEAVSLAQSELSAQAPAPVATPTVAGTAADVPQPTPPNRFVSSSPALATPSASTAESAQVTVAADGAQVADPPAAAAASANSSATTDACVALSNDGDIDMADFEDEEEAEALRAALLLSQQPHSGVVRSSAPPPLPPLPPGVRAAELVALAKDAQESNSARALQTRVYELFSDGELLSSSFWPDDQEPNTEPQPCQKEIARAYDAILGAADRFPVVLVALNNALLQFLAQEDQATAMRQATDEHFDVRRINQYVVVFAYPPLLEDQHQGTLSKLFKAAMRLPNKGLLALQRIWHRLPSEQFQHMVRLAQEGINAHVKKANAEYDSAVAGEAEHYTLIGFPEIGSFVRMLDLLRKTGNVEAREVDWYNDTLSSSRCIAWRREHREWQRNGGLIVSSSLPELEALLPGHKMPLSAVHSLIDTPWLLRPAAKQRVLHADARYQMNLELRDWQREQMLAHMTGMQHQDQNPYLILKVHRDNIVQDTMQQISRQKHSLKKPLKVKFIGEEGVDEGGVRKEFFLVMIRQLLDPQYAMFTVDAETRLMWFNGSSLEANMEFELVGVLMGLAIYNSTILDVSFPKVTYRKLMGYTPTLDDLANSHPALARGLMQLLESQEPDIAATFGLNFEVTQEVFGELKSVELKEGGAETPVTAENRQEYVDLYVQWYLVRSVEHQFAAFQRGFMSVFEVKDRETSILKLFDPAELELLICGSPVLDFEALAQAARYTDGFDSESPTVQHLWSVMSEFSEDDKKKFLMFATGCDRAPINGLSDLSLTVSRNGPDSDQLPTSHTCFNHLLLPEYATREKLKERLMIAIRHAEGFGSI